MITTGYTESGEETEIKSIVFNARDIAEAYKKAVEATITTNSLIGYHVISVTQVLSGHTAELMMKGALSKR